jgi:hypothetical protein
MDEFLYMDFWNTNKIKIETEISALKLTNTVYHTMNQNDIE